MSYDLEIGVKVDGLKDKYVGIDEPRDYASPTYNLGKMFRVATGWDFEQGKWYNVEEVLSKIEHGLTELRRYPHKYEQYEPENHWGTVNSAIKALQELLNCIYSNSAEKELPYSVMYVRW